jgi:hypothetical protein
MRKNTLCRLEDDDVDYYLNKYDTIILFKYSRLGASQMNKVDKSK